MFLNDIGIDICKQKTWIIRTW